MKALNEQTFSLAYQREYACEKKVMKCEVLPPFLSRLCIFKCALKWEDRRRAAAGLQRPLGRLEEEGEPLHVLLPPNEQQLLHQLH